MTAMNLEEPQNSNPSEQENLFADMENESELGMDHSEESEFTESDQVTNDKSKKEKKTSVAFQEFSAEIEKVADADTKLQKAIEFMENSLSQNGNPNFRNFWDARTICLNLFKENITPVLRAHLWNKYSELSKEARRLKEILDEQTAFAVEQIEIAVHALETDVDNYRDQLDKMSFEFEIPSETLKNKQSEYTAIQKELNLLNTQASRVNALRKELIKTEMRIKQKNKFFQRLSSIGDKIFPRRKELIKEISQLFSNDVENFIQKNFQNKDLGDSLFFLREEIKALQSMAKLLTLNTQSFTQTRMHLSECWDKIKVEEKERKKVRAQQKAIFKQNFDEAFGKIQEVSTSINESMSMKDANQKIDEILQFMKSVDLGRDEIRILKDEIAKVKKPILEKMRQEEAEKHAIESEKENQRKQKVIELKQEIEDFSQKLPELSLEEIHTVREDLNQKISKSGLNKFEKQEIERLLKKLKNAISDAISEQKEKALLNLSDDERETIQQLKDVLNQRKERRQEIKAQIELLKKASSSSGLDIEQAMNIDTQMSIENDRLKKINLGIQEIENKIAQFDS
ncbi:hypothetical protein BN1013_00919 [Candidatus Rubidus massiliensis]|nr:hypothetical protein BN1013_00919 [Candidatus Rubidus massiliensis]